MSNAPPDEKVDSVRVEKLLHCGDAEGSDPAASDHADAGVVRGSKQAIRDRFDVEVGGLKNGERNLRRGSGGGKAMNPMGCPLWLVVVRGAWCAALPRCAGAVGEYLGKVPKVCYYLGE